VLLLKKAALSGGFRRIRAASYGPLKETPFCIGK
jgi:hypothetical protein